MQIESNVALISINATLIVQLVSFLVFLFIMNRIMFQPLNQAKGARDARMEELRREIKQAEQQVDEMMEALARKELQAKEDALQRQQVLEADAKRQVNQIFESLRAEIDTLNAENKQKIENQINDVKQHLPGEVHKVARVIMEKALERRLANETL